MCGGKGLCGDWMLRRWSMRLGWNQREILWRFMVNTRRSGRIFARIRKRRPFILTGSAEGGPTRKHLDLLLSEEFILNLVSNELQELFQDEFENFMDMFQSKGPERIKKGKAIRGST